jgi:hypothetical protein
MLDPEKMFPILCQNSKYKIVGYSSMSSVVERVFERGIGDIERGCMRRYLCSFSSHLESDLHNILDHIIE